GLSIPEESERRDQLDRCDASRLTGEIPKQESGGRALGSCLRQHVLGNVHAIRLRGERRYNLGDATGSAGEVEVARYPVGEQSAHCLTEQHALARRDESVERVTGEPFVVVGTSVQMGVPIVRTVSARVDR